MKLKPREGGRKNLVKKGDKTGGGWIKRSKLTIKRVSLLCSGHYFYFRKRFKADDWFNSS